MTEVIACPPNPILAEDAQVDDSDEPESVIDRKDIGIGEEKEPERPPEGNNNSDQLQQQEDNPPDHSSSSSAHTDSENEEEPVAVAVVANTEIVAPRNRRKILDFEELFNKNDPPEAEKISVLTEEQNANKEPESEIPQKWTRPLTPRSPRRSHPPSSAKKKLKESCDEGDTSSDDDEFRKEYRKGSYVQLRLRRKTLLRIEKFTDSDSRSRERMRSRALSPPSSSDEDNLHIGWVAYPVGLSSTRIHKGSRRFRGQRAACACAQALKCIFTPVTKVCRKCRINNKVWDSESVHEKLLDETPKDVIVDI